MPSRTHDQSIRADEENIVYHHPSDPKNVRHAPGLQFGKRHSQSFVAFLGIAASFIIRSHLAVAIVAMTEKSSFNDAPVLPWDSRMKGTALSSFYWGYIFVLIPAGRMSEKYGPKISLVSAMFVCGVVMVITPFAVMYGGFYWMIATRIILGVTQAFVFPSVNVMLSNWAPAREKGMLFSFIFSGVDFGSVVSMTMTGTLADSRWGWPAIFYVCGGIAIAWALVYAYTGANSPQDHKTISEGEKIYIVNSLPNNSERKDKLKIPWLSILSSTPLLAVVVAHCAGAWTTYTMLFQAPSYINAVLGLNMKRSGLLAALPYLSSLFAGNVYAMMSYWLNKKKCLSRTALLKSWNTFSYWGAALPLCCLAFAGQNEVLTVTLIIVTLTVHCGFHCGFHCNHLDLSPNFAGTLMGITTAISTICTVASPIYVGFIVTDPKSLASWRIVFLTVAAVLFVGNLIFIIFGTAEVQPWNFPPNEVKRNPDGKIIKNKITQEKSEDLE